MAQTKVGKAKSLIESKEEWKKFADAIQKSQPAIKTFTNEALIFVFLMLGKKGLRNG